MKKFFIVLSVLFVSVAAYAAVVGAPDGILIGADVNGRLAILDFDEYSVTTEEIGTMSAGEVKTLTFEGMDNLRMGTTLVVAPANPELYNQDNLLILHSYVSSNGTVKIMVKNLSSTSKTFGTDQWTVGGWNTVNN